MVLGLIAGGLEVFCSECIHDRLERRFCAVVNAVVDNLERGKWK